MRLVVDIDGTLTDVVSAIIYREHIPFVKSDVTKWDYKWRGIPIGDYINAAFKDRFFTMGLPLMPDAIVSLQALAFRGWEIVVASARPTYAEADTREWLVRSNVPFHKMECGAADKASWPADALIDDNFDTVIKFASLGGVGILMDQPWNLGFLPAGSVRVGHWAEVPALLLR